MDVPTQLRRIAERLRAIDTHSPDDADRYIKRHTSDAARLIIQNWSEIVAKSGMNWHGPPPFDMGHYLATAKHLDRIAEREGWESAWRVCATILWLGMGRGQHPGMPEEKILKRTPTIVASLAGWNPADWREQRSDYAEILDAVAEWLSDTKPKGGSQKPPRRRKNTNREKVDEHIDEVLKTGKLDLIEIYLFEAAHKLAERIVCGRTTLLKTNFWTNERKQMQIAWRAKHTKGARPKKKDQ